jgi:high affinity Mn2+ porin
MMTGRCASLGLGVFGLFALGLFMLAGTAQGADLSRALPIKAPPAPAVASYDWTGFYVGGHVAYGLGGSRNTLFDPDPIVSDIAFSRLFGGVQAGYNYVFSSQLLLGAEADITFPNFREDGAIFTGATAQGTSVADRIDYIATLRGRFGYAFGHWLIYGTGGFAWSQARFVETPGVASNEDKILLTRTGWTLGLGTEVAIAPNWTARIEYLYDRFGRVGGPFPSGTAYQSAFDIQMLRLGLNYKLGESNDSPVRTSSDRWLIARNSWNIHGHLY